MDLASTLYDEMGDKEKKNVEESHHEMLASFATCENELIKDLQRILATIIFEKITVGVASFE